MRTSSGVVVRHSNESCRTTKSSSESSSDRRCIAFGNDDDEVGIRRPEPRTRISGSRDDIEIDSCRKDSDQGFTVHGLTDCSTRRRILEIDARRSRCDST